MVITMKKKKLALIITILVFVIVPSVIIGIILVKNTTSNNIDAITDNNVNQMDSIDNNSEAEIISSENIEISDTIDTVDNSLDLEDDSAVVSDTNSTEEADSTDYDIVEEIEPIPVDIYDTITISAAGDVTLGRDEKFGWEKTFDHELEVQNGNFGYFFNNVKDIFAKDDLTIVNLETTLTSATKKADKKYRFKADPSYVEILKQGNIEAVSIANNHTLDFLDIGYKDTLRTLEEAELGYFGYEHKYITEIRDIKIGVLGYYSMKATDKLKDQIKEAIQELRDEDTDLVIVMFHWGIERDYWPNSVQKELAYSTIDSGADLVLGSHPHVLQGIEEYNGKQIVYSLGNFCFGGNKNPHDKDTMIYIQKFNFKNNELLSQEYDVIPCSISSVSNRNNYQPTPLEGVEADRVMKKIEKYSDF